MPCGPSPRPPPSWARWWRCGSRTVPPRPHNGAPSTDRPRVAAARLALSLATVGYAAVASFIVLDLDANGTGHGATAFTALAATVVLTRLIGGDLPDRIGPLRCAAGAAAIEVVGLALIALATSLPVALAGARDGRGVRPASIRLCRWSWSTASPESRRGTALGTFTAFFDIGVGVGGPMAGLAVSLGDTPPHSGSPPPARSAPSRWPMRSEEAGLAREHRHQSPSAPLTRPPRPA